MFKVVRLFGGMGAKVGGGLYFLTFTIPTVRGHKYGPLHSIQHISQHPRISCLFFNILQFNNIDLNIQEFICKLKINHRAIQELSLCIRVTICSLAAAGYTKQSLATLFSISRHTIHSTIEHWNSHHTFDSRPRVSVLRFLCVSRSGISF